MALLEAVFSEASKLSLPDKVRLMERLASDILATDLQNSAPDEWRDFIDRTAGILSDDPIIRWPQGDYEQRASFP